MKTIRASILILALWSLFLLSTFVLSMGYGIRQKLSVVSDIEKKDKLFYIAEAGVKRAIYELKNEQVKENEQGEEYSCLNDGWNKNTAAFNDIDVGDGSFNVSIVDEERKININTQKEAVISKIFQLAAELDSEEADDLAASIVDWRDKDSQTLAGGAEANYYENLENPYTAKNNNFEVLDELLLVKGMKREIFEKAAPYITIYGSGYVNINTAGEKVLLALGIEDETVKKILAYRRGTDDIEGTADDNAFKVFYEIIPNLSQAYSLSPDEMTQLSNLVAANAFCTQSNNFLIKSTAKLKVNPFYTDIVCLFLKGDKIYYWREVERTA